MIRRLLALVAAVLAFAAPAWASGGPFSDWAAVVVAGDFRASGGGTTQAFENARRDVAKALVGAGFDPLHVRTLSLLEDAPAAERTTRSNLVAALHDTASQTRSGCLFYITSHGSPQGAVFGAEGLLAPRMLDRLLEESCGARPTVVFISACYSGVYVPALAAPNRMVLTAARPDRTSFGCGVSDRYPFFDACVLESWPKSADFLVLGRAVQACVARREQEMQLSPASEPQVSAGARIRALLPLLPLQSRLAPAA